MHLAAQFLQVFTGRSATSLSLDDLDHAFGAWSCSDERQGYTDEAVIEILGAAYGQLCIEQLGMRWVKVSDAQGTALAVQGLERNFRAFPYHSISKRITDREVGFFRPIFVSLQSMSREDLKATDVV